MLFPEIETNPQSLLTSSCSLGIYIFILIEVDNGFTDNSINDATSPYQFNPRICATL